MTGFPLFGSLQILLGTSEWLMLSEQKLLVLMLLFSFLFFSQMGLGKTIQAIAISYYYKNEWPLLIVVPSSLRYPWVDEMEKWIPELSPDDISIIQNKTDIG